MRILYLIIGCFSLSMLTNKIYAQNIELRNTEFGYNCMPLISNLLPFNDPITISSNDILLVYKKKFGQKNWFFRSGIKANYISEGVSTEDVLVNLRLGLEKKKYVAKRWIFHTGAELFTSLMGPEVGKLERGEVGMAGILGFQLMLNERIGLGTEAYMTISYIKQDPPGQASDVEIISSGFILPRSMFFSIYF